MNVRWLLVVGAMSVALTAAGQNQVVRYDQARTGYTAEKLSPALALDWVFSTTEQAPTPAQPLVAGNRVFFCSEGKVYALDLETGAPVWD